MARRLATVVSVFDPKGNLRTFEPGDQPPAWAVKQITNPKAWELAKHARPEAGGQAGGGGEEPPPLAGPNAGRDQWAAYAASVGVDVGDDDKRDEIVAKLRNAGVAVE